MARVLVVDDETAILEVLRRYLEKKGHDVWTARDGAEALEILRPRPKDFDAVLTDVNMPEMNGGDLAYEIRGDGRMLGIEIAFMSSGWEIDLDTLRLIANQEETRFFDKPFDFEENPEILDWLEKFRYDVDNV